MAIGWTRIRTSRKLLSATFDLSHINWASRSRVCLGPSGLDKDKENARLGPDPLIGFPFGRFRDSRP